MKPTVKIAILLVSVAVAIAGYRVLQPRNPSPTAASLPAPRASDAAVPAAGAPASASGNLLVDLRWTYYQNKEASGAKEVLTPAQSGLPATMNAIRIRVDKAPKQFFDIGYNYHFLEEGFAQGEMVTFHFKARSSANNLITVQMLRDKPPVYTACWHQFVRLTPEWKDYTYTFPTAAFTPGEATLIFQLGDSAGNIDIADMSFVRGEQK